MERDKRGYTRVQTNFKKDKGPKEETNKTITNPPPKPTAFWVLNVSSPQTPEGSAKTVPGDPFHLDGDRASRALRIQQLSLLGNGSPLGVIPSYSPTSNRDLGSFSLQRRF
ncbi:hypothetical protein ACFX14_040532 [Malus domestica]